MRTDGTPDTSVLPLATLDDASVELAITSDSLKYATSELQTVSAYGSSKLTRGNVPTSSGIVSPLRRKGLILLIDVLRRSRFARSLLVARDRAASSSLTGAPNATCENWPSFVRHQSDAPETRKKRSPEVKR